MDVFQAPISNAESFTPLKKNEWFKKEAPKPVKMNRTIALILSLCCVLIPLLGTVVAMNTSMEQLVFVALMDEDNEAAEWKKEADDEYEDFEDFQKNWSEEIDELDNEGQDAIENYDKVLLSCTKSMSVNNMKKLAKAGNLVIDSVAKDIPDVRFFVEDVEDDVMEIIDLMDVIYVVAALSAIFSLLGGVLKQNWLVIFGLIITSLYCGLICGILFLILNVAVHAGILFFHGRIKKAYKEYASGKNA